MEAGELEMHKQLIMTRCRKVYIPLENNKIFASAGMQGEFEFVSIFRQQERAENVVKERSHMYIYDKPEKATVKREVGSFYLVPASLIEK